MRGALHLRARRKKKEQGLSEEATLPLARDSVYA